MNAHINNLQAVVLIQFYGIEIHRGKQRHGGFVRHDVDLNHTVKRAIGALNNVRQHMREVEKAVRVAVRTLCFSQRFGASGNERDGDIAHFMYHVAGR